MTITMKSVEERIRNAGSQTIENLEEYFKIDSKRLKNHLKAILYKLQGKNLIVEKGVLYVHIEHLAYH